MTKAQRLRYNYALTYIFLPKRQHFQPDPDVEVLISLGGERQFVRTYNISSDTLEVRGSLSFAVRFSYTFLQY